MRRVIISSSKGLMTGVTMAVVNWSIGRCNIVASDLDQRLETRRGDKRK
jgi:hypothetical protein